MTLGEHTLVNGVHLSTSVKATMDFPNCFLFHSTNYSGFLSSHTFNHIEVKPQTIYYITTFLSHQHRNMGGGCFLGFFATSTQRNSKNHWRFQKTFHHRISCIQASLARNHFCQGTSLYKGTEKKSNHLT